MIDFEQEVQQGPTQEQLSRVSGLAEQQVDLEQRIEETEAELKRLKEEHRKVAEDALPEALQEAGLSSITTQDGTKVEVEEKLYCSVPKARKEWVRQWLEHQGHGALVQYRVVAALGKGDQARADELVRMLQEQGVQAGQEADFHTGQLKSLLNEMIQEGEDVDLSQFGAHLRRAAKVST